MSLGSDWSAYRGQGALPATCRKLRGTCGCPPAPSWQNMLSDSHHPLNGGPSPLRPPRSLDEDLDRGLQRQADPRCPELPLPLRRAPGPTVTEKNVLLISSKWNSGSFQRREYNSSVQPQWETLLSRERSEKTATAGASLAGPARPPRSGTHARPDSGSELAKGYAGLSHHSWGPRHVDQPGACLGLSVVAPGAQGPLCPGNVPVTGHLWEQQPPRGLTR